jgi:nickel transport protein
MAPRILLAFVAAAWLAGPARAHEVVAEVTHDRAVAVRARSHDGGGLANATAEVFSPADAAVPFQKGRTDRNGWMAFVPDVPGRWRVRVVDDTGHGVTVEVDVPAPGVPVAGPAGPAAPSPPPSSPRSDWITLARPLAGVALIAALFGFLSLRGRRRSP